MPDLKVPPGFKVTVYAQDFLRGRTCWAAPWTSWWRVGGSLPTGDGEGRVYRSQSVG